MRNTALMRRVLAPAVIAILCLAFAPAASAVVSIPYRWVPAALSDPVNLREVSTVEPGAVWAVGNIGGEGRVYRFNGSAWSPALGGLPLVYGISVLDSTHLWVTGALGTIRFFNGSTWSDQSVGGPDTINSVCALGPSQVWAVGQGGKAYFFNGSAWSATVLGGGTSELKGVFALDSKHVWAVGTAGTIFFFDGNSWVDQSPGGNDLWDVCALDFNSVWAVGSGGTVQFFDGRTWTASDVGVSVFLSGVFVLDAYHVFVSAAGGEVTMFDGSAWTRMATGTATDLWGICAVDTDHIYAVGDAGHLVRGSSTLEAQSTVFYFAEGTCRPGFDPYLCVQNPNDTDAQVRIAYMLGNGTTDLQDITVPGLSRATVSVKSRLGTGDDDAHDFSAKVECTNGLAVVAERPMYFSYNSSLGTLITGGSDVVGALQPRTTFYFAEGTCRPSFDPYFCVQNPNTAEALVDIHYMLGNGATQVEHLAVPARSRRTVAVKNTLGSGDDAAHDFSARVQSTNGQRIVVERPMYFTYQSSTGVQVRGGHDVVGAPAPARTFYFAEGTCRPSFDPYICILNPGPAAAQVQVTYMRGDGTTHVQDLSINSDTRATVNVKTELGVGDDAAHDFSTRVEAKDGARIVAERPMYFTYINTMGAALTGGHDVVGALYPAGGYFFAEGSCRPNFDTYICLQNPRPNPVNAVITYMKGDGGNALQTLTVPGHSRITVNVKDTLGSANDPAHDFSAKVSTLLADDDIIAERPMYFMYGSSTGAQVPGGHDVVGYSP